MIYFFQSSSLYLAALLVPFSFSGTMAAADVNALAYYAWAQTPPMGWNSWDCFGTSLTETQAHAQVDAMERHLKPFGWNFFTVDIQWYEGESSGFGYRDGAKLTMDGFGRLTPAPKKFPSAVNNAGFKPLADYVHEKGLKFGIHIMRGIPRQAVEQNTPILDTAFHAKDIVRTSSICDWNPDMYGVDMNKSGSQEYYDSLFKMYASWGLDFIKVDDISRPYDSVQKAEIEGIRKAIDKCGRPIVLSLSPGDTPIEQGEHVMQQANMWRISDDFWDMWAPLHGMLGRLDKWTKYRKVGAWPDADMLPFGIVRFNKPTRFTQHEQRLCMTLWCIAKSPLILGADMTQLDQFTLDLLTNKEVIDVNQKSISNRQLSCENDLVIWTAETPNCKDRYVAFFNAQTNDSINDLLRKAVYTSPSLQGGNREVDISVRIPKAKKIKLLVGDNGNYDCDHAAWIRPTLTGPKGTLDLTTDLKWKTATAGWGTTLINRTCDDKPLVINKVATNSIGTHAPSVIEYDLPEGYDAFQAKGVLLQDGSIQFGVSIDNGESTPQARSMSILFSDLGIAGNAAVRDLWDMKDLGEFSGSFSCDIPFHGARIYRISPKY